jgi:hypothetical protein
MIILAILLFVLAVITSFIAFVIISAYSWADVEAKPLVRPPALIVSSVAILLCITSIYSMSINK